MIKDSLKKSKSPTTKTKALEEENQELQTQLAIMRDREALKENSIYRQQKLAYLERIARSLEKLEGVLEEAFPETEETEEK